MKNLLLFLLSCCISILFMDQVYSKTWLVGSTKSFKSPSAVANIVGNYDTILIDSEVYSKDVCFWKAHHLLIQGVNGRPQLKSGGTAAGQKAIWVVQGDSTIIENIEFSECKVPDKNGAGIRLEGTHLVIRNCYFHHNEDGILAGDNSNSDVLIEYSEFAFNGYGDGQSHNLYINHVRSLIFRYNYSHDAVVGHLLKSRAISTYIYYNRLSEENGNGSYEIDLPNGGYSVILGNIIEQGINSQNSAIISYGKEGLNNPSSNEIYLSHNTIINNKSNGTFLQVQNGISLVFSLNNIYAGPGTLLSGVPNQMQEYGSIKNISINYFQFVDASKFNFSLRQNSPAYNTSYFSLLLFPLLSPIEEYNHVANKKNRNTEYINEVGAIESHFISPFVQPLEGIYSKDFIINNYVDWKMNGFQDGFCGSKTYDGHQGTDFIITGFEQMQKGVKVVAVDSGIVCSTKDGLFDMETVSDTSKHLGNYICIKHPGNYYTYYGHLKKNSILVKAGDIILPSQNIAEIGCSGNCTDPHLHFELWWDSLQVIDPFQSACGNFNSFWKNQLKYDSSFQIWKSGLKAGTTGLDSCRFNQYSRLLFSLDKDYYISYWNLEYGLRKNDKSTMQWFNEAGTKVWQFDYIQVDDAWYYYYFSNVDVKTMGICDHCKAKYFVNDKLKDEIDFKVAKLSNNNELDINDIISIHLDKLESKEEISQFEMFGLDGRQILKMNTLLPSTISLAFIQEGIYIIKFSFHDKTFYKKVFIGK